VALIYLSEALVLGIVALTIGLPLGIVGGRYLSAFMAVLLNFDLGSLAPPLWVPLSAATAALAVPLASAAHPVLKGTRISVRRALDDFGVSSDNFGSGAFDRFLAGARGLSPAALLVFRNSFRRRTRLVLTVTTLAASGVLFLTGLNLRRSLIHTLDRVFASRKFDLSVNLGGLSPLAKVQREVLETPGIRSAEGWIVTEAAKAGETNRFSIVGLPPKTTMQDLDIVEGRGLMEGDADAIVVNTALSAGDAPMRVGNTLALQLGPRHASFRIVGIARERMSSPTAYVSRDYLDRLNGGGEMVNSLRLALDPMDIESVNRIRIDIERNLEREQVRAQVASKADGRYSFDQHMLMIYVFLVIVSGAIAVIGGLGLMTTMSLNVIERRRELGILRAIGASPALICTLIVAEGLVIGILSWTLATLLSWPLSYALGNVLTKYAIPGGIDFQFAPGGILIWLAVSTALSAVAAVTPAWRATRLTVREALTRT
jgi:putative ABC transport system permease protein